VEKETTHNSKSPPPSEILMGRLLLTTNESKVETSNLK